MTDAPALTAPPVLPPPPSSFVIMMDDETLDRDMVQLALWVKFLIMPTYGREVTSAAPWCSRRWEHHEAVALLHGIWLAWQELGGPMAGRTGPATWHRDHLLPTMTALRDPSGPFAGCRPGQHRDKQSPVVDDYPGTELDDE